METKHDGQIDYELFWGQERKSYEYTLDDKSPFAVHFDYINQKEANIYRVGSIIKTSGNYGDFVTELKCLGRNKFIVYFQFHNFANAFVKSEFFKNKGFKAIILCEHFGKCGILSGIPIDITEEEIKNGIQSEHKVLEVCRLSRSVDGKLNPTHHVGVIFRGTELPEKVKLFWSPIQVKPFEEPLTLSDNLSELGISLPE